MLKNTMITLILLCGYLSSLILFKQLHLDDAFNIILSSILLGIAMKILVNQNNYLVVTMVFLSLLFSLMKDFISIPMMICSLLFGHFTVYFIYTQMNHYRQIQRRTKSKNREFLN